MGCQQSFELLEDFIRETKNNNVKTIFFNLATLRDEANPNQMFSKISVSALSKDGKDFYSHSKVVSWFEGEKENRHEVSYILLTDKTSKQEVDAFVARGRAEIDVLLQTFQDKFASANLIAGFCQPNGA